MIVVSTRLIWLLSSIFSFLMAAKIILNFSYLQLNTWNLPLIFVSAIKISNLTPSMSINIQVLAATFTWVNRTAFKHCLAVYCWTCNFPITTVFILAYSRLDKTLLSRPFEDRNFLLLHHAIETEPSVKVFFSPPGDLHSHFKLK
jgi:hypothetical protein